MPSPDGKHASDGASEPRNRRRERKVISTRGPIVFATMAMCLLGVGIGGWAARATLSGAVIAGGSIVVERNVKKVQHSYGGIVAEINVRNGDLVEAGAVLVRLDATQIRAELGIVETQQAELTARGVRLAAERDNAKTLDMPQALLSRSPEARTAAEGELRLFRENARTRDTQKEQLRLRIGQIEEEITGLSAQRDAKAGELVIIARELEQVSHLFKKALTPATRVYAMEREMKRISGEHGGLIAQIARAHGQISEINVQIIAVDETARAQAQRELRDVEARLAEVSERAIVARDKLQRIEIRAPQKGTVHELAVHTVGGVVTSAEQLMLIVPEGETLVVQARIQPTDVDQVMTGREARLRLSAFHQQETPELKGRVIGISADTSSDNKSGQSFYVARLEIADPAAALPKEVKLVPGMPVEVFISTGDRTALSYLAKPFTDQMRRAFRE